MKRIVRFAPSPTGNLHVGNIRTALLNWLYIKSVSGKFILRIDDTDTIRSKKEYEENIKTDLKWLGLNFDTVENQLLKLQSYENTFELLRKKGYVYPCYETPEELEYMRKRLISRGKPPIYDRSALKLSPEEITELENKNIKPHWRFKLDNGEITWNDKVRGNVKFKSAALSDPVIRRADGSFLYMLPSTVDDIDMKISLVMRGEDHVNNTAIQIKMFQALDAPIPEFAHFPLVSDKNGEALSKRLGSISIQKLRALGYEPMAINSLLAHLGTNQNITPHQELSELVELFDFSKFGRSTAKFNPQELESLNAKIIHNMPFSKAKEKLAQLQLNDINEQFWNTIKANISFITQTKAWYDLINKPITPIIENKELMDIAIKTLPKNSNWDTQTWKQWIDEIKQHTNLNGKHLFLPLRLAITGLPSGPELKYLLPLIGYEKTIQRLQGISI